MMEKRAGFASLIRVVDKKNAPHKPGEETIVPILLNPERKPWQSKKEAYYLVSKTHGQCEGVMNARMDDFPLNLSLGFLVSYRLRLGTPLSDKMAQDVAVQLYHDNGPQAGFESLLQQQIERYADTKGGRQSFIESYLDPEQQAQLSEFLRKWASEELHFELYLHTKLPSEPVVNETEKIPAFCLMVTFRDVDKALELKVDEIALELSHDPKVRIYAYVRSGGPSTPAGSVRKRLLELIRNEYDFDRFRGTFLPPQVKQSLKKGLQDTASGFGRTVSYFDFHCDDPILKAPESFLLQPDFSFSLSVPEYAKSVNVTTTLQMELKDLGRYAAANTPDLTTWSQETLQSVIKPRLSRHTYVNLANIWESEISQIEAELSTRAEAIGFQWIHSKVTTSLPFDRVRRPFQLEFEQEFTTSSSDSQVTLNVNAWVRITDMGKLAHELPSEIEIDNRLREELIWTLQRVAKEHSPKEWHLYFDVHSADYAAPLKTLVQHAIQEKLVAFGGNLVSLTVTRAGNLMKSWLDLREQAPLLDKVEVTRQNFPVKLAYRVIGIAEEHWHRFEATTPTTDALEDLIRRHVEQIFADDDPAEFRRLSTNQIIKRLNIKEAGPRVAIANQYGLQIYFDHWIRESEEVEKQEDELRVLTQELEFSNQANFLRINAAEEAQDITRLSNQKKTLRDRLAKLDPIDDKQEVEALEKELTTLAGRIKEKTSPALRHVIDMTRNDSERRLAASLGQEYYSEPPKLLDRSKHNGQDVEE